MEDKYLLLYKDHSIKTVSEKKIYQTIDDDKDDIWNILVPIQSTTTEYLLVKPKKFIPRFKCITFDYYLTVHIFGDTNLFLDLDGDQHIYQRVSNDKKSMIKCYTPIEFYSTLYSISRIQSLNNIFSFGNDMYDYFEITFDDMVIDFDMVNKRYLYRSSSVTKESENADFEGEVTKLLKTINQFIGTNILRGKKNAISLKNREESIFVNNDSTWGKAECGKKEFINSNTPFEITQIKDIDPNRCNITYLQSLSEGDMKFKSTIFVYPEDIALISKYIDEIEIMTVFFSYDTPIELWPLGTTVCSKVIYDNDELTSIHADYEGHVYSVTDTIRIVCNIVSIYRALNIVKDVLYGDFEMDVMFEITLRPIGNHSDEFCYPIYSGNVDKVKDTYNDFFKKLRRFLVTKGYVK